MPEKPQRLLLDATEIIEAKRQEVWDTLITEYEIIVPSVVVTEAHFYIDSTGQRIAIDLESLVTSGAITQYTATSTELANIAARFTSDVRDGLHAGELEALSCLASKAEDQGFKILSSDGAAIRAVALLGLREHAICLADVLQRCGAQKKLPPKHGPEFLKTHLDEGSQMRIQGIGITK